MTGVRGEGVRIVVPLQTQKMAPPTPIQSHPHNSPNNVALGMIGGAFVATMAFTMPFVSMQLRSSLPYMATPRSKVVRALKFISNRATSSHKKETLPLQHASMQQPIKNNRKRQLNFVDLGSGDGTAVLAAASLGWNATGLELNPSLWIISSIRRVFSASKEIRSNSQFVFGDMFQNEVARKRLQGANCVMIFGVQSLMPKIAALVQNECRPGCYLMSYRFRVPLLLTDDEETAAESIGGGKHEKKGNDSFAGINASLIYDEEEMRIYELLDKVKH